MFQFDFGKSVRGVTNAARKATDHSMVESVGVTFWEEHCLECAQPDCYRSCQLYIFRQDGNCARFTHGICENRDFEGLYRSGAEIRFRKWGKLQTAFGPGSFSAPLARGLAQFDATLSRLATGAALNRGRLRKLRSLNPQRYYQYARRRLLERMMRRTANEEFPFDDLLIEAWNLGSQSCRLFVEAYDSSTPSFRNSIRLDPGRNLTTIPFAELRLRPWQDQPRLRRLVLFPEDNAECHVVFTGLDLVRYKTDSAARRGLDTRVERAGPDARPEPASTGPSSASVKTKVKCVVWDLDNTMWRGILVEDGADGVSLREEARRLLDQFDSRGILQSIASKNDHARAWELVEKLGIAEYFLYPEINWGPKSTSLRQIAAALNIGVDSLAFIDDSPFERAEVQQRLPNVRVYDAEELERLLDHPEFDVPVTQDGRRRREMYRTEQRRKEALSDSGDDYDAFLKDCRICVRLFHPAGDEEIARCAELLQRTNQLNLSGNRYETADLHRLISDDKVFCLAVDCRDRFGDYGLVGFLSIRLDNGEATIADLALSCRVAQKTVEHAIIGWLLSSLRSKGVDQLRAHYVATDRNKPLQDVLKEIGFADEKGVDRESLLGIGTALAVPRFEIVSVDTSDVHWR